MSKGYLDGAARYGLPGLVTGLALAWWSGGHGPTARAQGATPGAGSNDVIAFAAPVSGSPSQMLYLVNTKQSSFAVYRVEPGTGPKGSGAVRLEAARKFEYDLKLQSFNNLSPSVSDVEEMVPTTKAK